VTVLDTPRVDTIILDETILDEEPGCQFKHRRVACSVDVTHVVTGCAGPILACTNSAEYKKRQIRERTTFCRCGKPAEDCWAVVPV
jgi:hypothetical protein